MKIIRFYDTGDRLVVFASETPFVIWAQEDTDGANRCYIQLLGQTFTISVKTWDEILEALPRNWD